MDLFLECESLCAENLVFLCHNELQTPLIRDNRGRNDGVGYGMCSGPFLLLIALRIDCLLQRDVPVLYVQSHHCQKTHTVLSNYVRS